MQSNMEKTAAWALEAENIADPIERQAAASVAQVYATMVVADRLTQLIDSNIRLDGGTPIGTPDVNYWGDGS